MTPSLFDAEAARDSALELVTENAGDWIPLSMAAVRSMPFGWKGTAEDLRLYLIVRGHLKPHHHNAWGALIRMAQDKKLISKTGEMRNMRTRKSHARMTPVYVRAEKGHIPS